MKLWSYGDKGLCVVGIRMGRVGGTGAKLRLPEMASECGEAIEMLRFRLPDRLGQHVAGCGICGVPGLRAR